MLRHMAEILWTDGMSREEVARCELEELGAVLRVVRRWRQFGDMKRKEDGKTLGRTDGVIG